MATKKKRAFKSKIAIGIVFLIAVIYTSYHLLNFVFYQDLHTVATGVIEHNKTVGGRGYVFRDEIIMSSKNGGIVDYKIDNGSKIADSQPLADVYEEGGKEHRSMIRSFDEYIALLEKSEVGAEPLDIIKLEAEADNMYKNLVRLLNEGEAGELSVGIEQMIVALNKINILSNGQANITKTLNGMRDIRNNMFKGDYITESAPVSGYFYYYPDGYEDRFKSSNLSEMTAEKFYSLEKSLLAGESKLGKNVYGKMANDSRWHLVIELSQHDAANLSLESQYGVTFPENNNTKLDMKLVQKIPSDSKSTQICVFYCSKLPENFELSRTQDVKIDVISVKGISVPRSAITIENGVRGVYVLKGSVVHFRCIDIVYEDSDYCLVSTNGKDNGRYYALGTNEMIITNGNNLFDGRVLE